MYKIRKITILLLLITSAPLFSQEKGRSCYIKKTDWNTGMQAQIPTWVTATQNENTYVGVSDPQLNPQLAKEQAIQRGCWLYSLEKGIEVSILFEYFEVNERDLRYERNDSKFVSLFKFPALCHKVTYTLLDTFVNIYGEYFCRIHLTPSSQNKNLYSSYTEGLYVTNKERYETQEMRFSTNTLYAESPTLREHIFTFKGNEKRMRFEDIIDNTPLKIPRSRYRYQNSGTNTTVQNESYNLNCGYWASFMQSLSQSISLFNYPSLMASRTEENNINEKNIDQKERQSDLKRVVAIEKIAIKNNGSVIRENRITSQWHISTIK